MYFILCALWQIAYSSRKLKSKVLAWQNSQIPLKGLLSKKKEGVGMIYSWGESF